MPLCIFVEFQLLTCFDNTQSNLADLTVDIGWVRHLAGVGAIIFELDLSNYDGSITPHDITCPRDALLEDALIRRIWFCLVEKDLQMGKEFKKTCYSIAG